MEPDQRQFLANAWPLIAVVLMASGILVKTVPLESKRPIDPDRVKFAHAGRQDIEARLWEDPFVAMRHVKGRWPMERCAEAIADWAHHPSALAKSLLQKSSGRWITLLPVMVSGGPYFEDSEGRRRSRYAVVTALLNSGWRPSDEDKLGYVWTFESCIENHWERRAPELLPYEWFVQPGQSREETRALLVLWVDEDALTRQPLAGIERIIEILVHRAPPCPPSADTSSDGLEKLTTRCETNETPPGCPWKTEKIQDDFNQFGDASFGYPMQKLPPLPWCDIRIIGPSASSSLLRLARELARGLVQELAGDLARELAGNLTRHRAPMAFEIDHPAISGEGSAGNFARQHATTDASWLRFYSSGATSQDINFKNIAINSWSGYYKNIDRNSVQNMLHNVLQNSFKSLGDTGISASKDSEKLRESFKNRVMNLATANEKLPGDSIAEEKLRESFTKRVIRLTTTDDKLAEELIKELRLRLADATPLALLSTLFSPQGALQCDDTVVVISEGDTSYARSFHESFQQYFRKNFSHCTEEGRFRAVYYLRGLDGVLPEGKGTPVPSESPPGEPARANTDVVFEQATLERADGPSQYDYLRRLAGYLADLDRREKQAGRHGVRAIGVLGHDVYDKILVLDALRDRFPKAVFFAADLDARLFGRKGLRSTRNLIVASSYGLTLNPGIQGAVPPFRDTYQSGMYLSTLVALNPVVQRLSPADVASWFETPQLFEIGRTRAVPLSKGPDADCKMVDLQHCNIHALDEWAGFSPWPNLTLMLTLIATATVAVILGGLLSHRLHSVTRVVWHNTSLASTVVVLLVLLLLGVGWIIWHDVTSGTGEPFAWFEGVSIWPTKILELLILLVTVGLLFYGRWQLRCDIDTVAQIFHLRQFSQHISAPTPRAQGRRDFWNRVRWLWWFDQAEMKASGNGTKADPWLDFLDRMRWRPTFTRVFVMTALYFIFGVALISLDWPFSPHRGSVSAWFNHTLLLALLLSMMALLLTVLDASEMTRRYFTYLGPHTLPQGEEPTDKEFWTHYPVGDDAIRLWTRFRFAVDLASRVNRFIYLPFVPLLLALPTRSRVFDAWDIPLPYVALLGVSIVLAMRGALSLRHAATELKTQTLVQLDHMELTAKLAQHDRSPEANAMPTPVDVPEPCDMPAKGMPAAARVDRLPADSDHESTPAPDDLPPQVKADLLRRIADEIRSVQEGPFRPWPQEPVVRALLVVSGWAGGISTIEFLFLK
jgi:hypothetical protein